MRSARATLFGAVLIAAAAAGAADRPVEGTKLVLRRTALGDEKLVFVSKDPAALFSSIGGSDDPSVHGAVVEVFSQAEPTGATIAIPAGIGVPGWTVSDGTRDTFRFTNRDAPDALSSVRVATFKQGRVLKVTAKTVGLALAGPQFAVGVRITTGLLRNCTLFDASTVRNDGPGVFVARHASAAGIADCSAASLGGTPTTTTLPAVCGDAVVASPEECDGSGAACPSAGLSCRPPGVVAECTCCVQDDGGVTQAVGCCNPSSVLIPSPDLGGFCLARRCDPPHACNTGYGCEPDGTCCAPLGTACASQLPIFEQPVVVPCCSGLECRGPGSAGLACCLPDAEACTDDAECCSQHCSGGFCDACRGAGQPCDSPFECCSLSCTAGTCDACAPAGSGCVDDAACCSGACDDLTFTCFP